MSPAGDNPGTTWEFANEVQKVWKGVEIEFFVLFSLALQVILIFFAGHRKRVVSWWLSLLLWLAYLLADLVAVYTLGLLYKNQNRVDFDPRGPPPDRCDDHLLAFWSPFLILHLGGPDTITSYSLEDNELWLRHLLTVVFQVTLAALVIGKSLPGTSLFLPAALLFTAGFLKYIERTLALRSASMSCLRKSLLPSPGPDPKVLAAIDSAKIVREEVDGIKKELAATDKELAAIDEELAAIENELLAIQEQLAPIQEQLAEVRKQLTAIKKEKKAAVKEKNPAIEAISARENELTAKQKKLAASDKELAIEKGGLTARKVKLANQKEELTARKEELTRRKTVLESELTTTKAKLAARKDDARKKAVLLVVAINPDETYFTVVRQAHRFFLTFRRLIVDLRPSFEHQNDSRSFFLQRPPLQAFKVIEVELAFMYEMLHTKAALIHTVAGRLIRSITCAISLTALLLFLNINKDGCRRTNVIITYVLLGGALALETYAIGLMILSFWMVIHLEGQKLGKRIFAIANLIQPETRPRWSNSMAQYNLIDLCLRDRPTTWRKIVNYLGVEELWDQHWYTAHAKVQDELKKLIYRELVNYTDERTLQRKRLEALVLKDVPAEFDKSILMWHIATDLCYCHRGFGFLGTVCSPPDMSRKLSNYMLYLLVMRPFMLPAGRGQIKITIADTCAHAKRFFGEKTKYTCWERDCWKLLNKNVDSWDSWAVQMTGDRTHSVLFEACTLAQELFKIEPAEKRWEVINGVWVEMLAYAASRCRVNFYAKQLTAGGSFSPLFGF